MRATRKRWKSDRDPLYRGDDARGIRLPVPTADPSIVRHIMYLGGAGRDTPYLSTSESQSAAEHFARKNGSVWMTRVPVAKANGIGHRPLSELKQLLQKGGKGDATWPRASVVLVARKYAEQWLEHLLDFRTISSSDETEVRRVVDEIFEERS